MQTTVLGVHTVSLCCTTVEMCAADSGSCCVLLYSWCLRADSVKFPSANLLGVSREQGKKICGVYIGNIFPYSPLTTSKQRSKRGTRSHGRFSSEEIGKPSLRVQDMRVCRWKLHRCLKMSPSRERPNANTGP